MELQNVLATVEAALPILKIVARITPTEVDDGLVAWLGVFVADPKTGIDMIAGEQGQQIRDSIKAMLPWFQLLSNKFSIFKGLTDFLTFMVTDPTKAFRTVGLTHK